MRICYAAFAHVGKKSGSKGMETAATIRAIEDAGIALTTYALWPSQRGVKTLIIPTIIYKGLAIINKAINIPYRRWAEYWFDRAVRKRLEGNLFYAHTELPLSLREAHRRSMNMVMNATTMPGMNGLRRGETHVDLVLAVSEKVASAYRKLGYGNVVVVPPGVDIEHYHPMRIEPEEFTILMVAHYTKNKGFETLLSAWKKLRKEKSKLVFVGRPMPGAEELMRKDRRIVFSGPLEDPAEAYRSASVFVLPSFSDGNSKAVLEALASGLPVVCTKESNSPIRHGREGFLFDAGDVASLAKYLEKLKNDSLRKMMGRDARRLATRYSWVIYGDRVLTQIRENSLMRLSKARGR